MTLILFLAKVIVCSGALFGYYFFFLRNKQFHQYNRYYLLIGAAFSFLFPLLQIPVFQSGHAPDNVLFKTLKVITVSGWEDEFVINAHRNFLSSFLTFRNIALVIYLAGLFILISYVIRFAVYIRKLSHIYKREQINTVKFYKTREPGTPFSFFNSLFWDEKILLTSEKGQQILRHELFHIRAGHSYDIVFMKCITIFFWFNPFYHLFMKEIKAIHEFLADEHASSSINKYDYAELLVTEAINYKNAFLSNQFFHNQIKRRIIMIIKNNPSKLSYMRRIMALPFLLILFCAFALKTSKHYAINKNFYNNTADQITAVIDAAHGGIDAGVQSINGLTEKDLTLSIARKIKDLSGPYGVKVILTRDKDILPGDASSIKDGLINRNNISEKSKADLFVSIHINAKAPHSTALAVNGFEIYVSGQNRQFDKSKLLGSAISGEIKKTYKISDALHESNSIYVLKASSVPAVMIECGFMTDQTDLDFITNSENQEKIAHDILRGIVNYHHSISPASNSTNLQKSEVDTVPASEIQKINPEDIESMNVSKEVIVIKLKNGDSIITRTKEYKAFNAKNKKDSAFDHNVIFTKVEVEATFPGESEGWSAYLVKNLKYPKEAIDKKIEGNVVIQFIVDKEGNISKVEAISGPTTGGLREEAIRVMKSSGKWIPGKQNAHPVDSYRKQHFTFKL